MPRSTIPNLALIAARYELVRELRGHRETVDWEAFDTALERAVVVQLLRPELATDAPATERFWQAARAAARETAPVGERVLDGGTDAESGQLFVVREWPAASLAEPGASRQRDYPPLDPKAGQSDGSPRRLLLLGGVVAVIVLAVALRPAVEGWLAWVNTPVLRPDRSLGLAPPAPVRTAGPNTSTAAPPTPVAAVRATPAAAVPTATPARTATATPEQRRTVVNTDGRGVALRGSPGGDRLPGKGYDEGATVQALEQSGEWTHIRGSDGREGWVLTVTLAP
jgi:hypothetical protein